MGEGFFFSFLEASTSYIQESNPELNRCVAAQSNGGWVAGPSSIHHIQSQEEHSRVRSQLLDTE